MRVKIEKIKQVKDLKILKERVKRIREKRSKLNVKTKSINQEPIEYYDGIYSF